MSEIRYKVEPGQVVPNPNGNDGNFFPFLFILIFALTIVAHYREGNIKQPTQQEQQKQEQTVETK